MDLELRTRKAKKGVVSSRYKGVSYHRQKNIWFARISVLGKVLHLGYRDTDGEAAELYAEAKAHFGQDLKKPTGQKIPKWKRLAV